MSIFHELVQKLVIYIRLELGGHCPLDGRLAIVNQSVTQPKSTTSFTGKRCGKRANANARQHHSANHLQTVACNASPLLNQFVHHVQSDKQNITQSFVRVGKNKAAHRRCVLSATGSERVDPPKPDRIMSAVLSKKGVFAMFQNR
jgi:hypothetical protein